MVVLAQARCFILDISEELLLCIFRYLEGRDILRCASACHQFLQIIAHSIEMEYKVELSCDTLTDCPSTLPTNERLRLLRQRRYSMRKPSLQKYIIPDALETNVQSQILEGDILASLVNMRFVNGAASPPTKQRLHILPLPSHDREMTATSMDHPLDIPIYDLAMDPPQNLLVLTEVHYRTSGLEQTTGIDVRLHLRALGHPELAVHPAARHPTLSARFNTSFHMSPPMIYGDVVALVIYHPQNQVFVWNWRTGQNLVCQTHSELPLDEKPTYLSFVSDRAYIVTDAFTPYPSGGCLQLFSFTDCDSHTGGTSVDLLQTQRHPTHIASLELPAVREGVTQRMVLHSATHSPSRHAPFTTPSAARLHLLTLHYETSGARSFRFIIDNSVFLRLLENTTSPCQAEKTKAPIIPWEKWGPGASRAFIRNDTQDLLRRHAHGRHLLLQDRRRHCLYAQLLCFDTSYARPQAPQRETHAFELLPGGARPVCAHTADIVTRPTTLPMGDVFRQPVVTWLPYHAAVEFYAPPDAEFAVADARLVVLKGGSGRALAQPQLDETRNLEVFVL